MPTDAVTRKIVGTILFSDGRPRKFLPIRITNTISYAGEGNNTTFPPERRTIQTNELGYFEYPLVIPVGTYADVEIQLQNRAKTTYRGTVYPTSTADVKLEEIVNSSYIPPSSLSTDVIAAINAAVPSPTGANPFVTVQEVSTIMDSSTLPLVTSVASTDTVVVRSTSNARSRASVATLIKGKRESIIVAAVNSQRKEIADIVCDGTNDEADILTAIGSLADGGCELVLMGGEFVFGAMAHIEKDGLTIRGQGRGERSAFGLPTGTGQGTRIRAATGFTGAYMLEFKRTDQTRPVHGVGVRDLHLDANGQGTAMSGVFWQVRNSLMENLAVSGAVQDGVVVQGISATLLAQGNNYLGILTQNNTRDGFALLANSSMNLITMLRSVSSGRDGVKIVGENNQISHLRSVSNTRRGVMFDSGGSYTQGALWTVESNQQEGVYFDSTTATINDVQINNLHLRENSKLATNTYPYLAFNAPANNIYRPYITDAKFTWISGNKPNYYMDVNSSRVIEADIQYQLVAGGAGTASTRDNGVRTILNRFGKNSGNPNLTGDWVGNIRDGVFIKDTTPLISTVYVGTTLLGLYLPL